MKLFNYLLIGLLPLGLAACNGNEPNGNGENGGEGGTTPTVSRTYNNVKGLVPDCADPYVLYHDGQYYLYGTGGEDGIKVYISTNLAKWTDARGATNGYALHKDDVFGDKWFWAPEVYYLDGKFYMFYSANERISVATANNPTGPFTQTQAEQVPFHDAGTVISRR